MAEAEARAGHDVTIVGLRRAARPVKRRAIGPGSLTIVSVVRPAYRKQSWVRRLAWSLATNAALIRAGWRAMRRSDVIRFTGSPPFLLYFVFAANLWLGKRLVYRITDFYPECIIAALDRRSLLLEVLRLVTNLLRRRIDAFEAIGEDLRRRLIDCGVDPNRIVLRRDVSPVTIGAGTEPLERPAALAGKVALLYSGNLGVAHDTATLLDGYRAHHRQGNGKVVLWLNATGSGAEDLAQRLTNERLPFVCSDLQPLDRLASLLVTPDAHLITLKPSFSGFVLPSKIYGCLASGKPLLFVGPRNSDVHALGADAGIAYRQVDPGDADGLLAALEALGSRSSFS